MSISRNSLLLAIGVLLSPMAATGQGPTGTWYVTAGDGGKTWMVHGATATPFAQANNPAIMGGEQAIAVAGDIRTLSNGPGSGLGSLYSLNGAYSGTSYAYPLPNDHLYDGTTDGLFNYSVGYNTGDVWQFARDWSAPSLLFSGQGLSLGITYDPTNNSLWIANFAFSTVSDFTFGGVQLSSFTVPFYEPTSLAMDYTDGTLWMGSQQSLGTFYQFDRNGSQLQSVTYANMANQNTLGGEFDLGATTTAPEPASVVLLGTGLVVILGAGARRRRRQDQ